MYKSKWRKAGSFTHAYDHTAGANSLGGVAFCLAPWGAVKPDNVCAYMVLAAGMCVKRKRLSSAAH